MEYIIIFLSTLLLILTIITIVLKFIESYLDKENNKQIERCLKIVSELLKDYDYNIRLLNTDNFEYNFYIYIKGKDLIIDKEITIEDLYLKLPIENNINPLKDFGIYDDLIYVFNNIESIYKVLFLASLRDIKNIKGE